MGSGEIERWMDGWMDESMETWLVDSRMDGLMNIWIDNGWRY